LLGEVDERESDLDSGEEEKQSPESNHYSYCRALADVDRRAKCKTDPRF
jgi:hypothetical protein